MNRILCGPSSSWAQRLSIMQSPKAITAPASVQLKQRRTQIYAAAPTPPKPSEDWIRVYRLPLIRWASAFNRLKLYQGAFTLVGTPACMALEQAHHVAANTSFVFGAIGLSGLITLAVCSLFIKNLVGLVHVNATGETVKLAYVDYWGKRRNRTIPVEDIVPTWEQAKQPRFDFYQMICLQSDKSTKYKMLQRFGVIEEPQAFVGIFGE